MRDGINDSTWTFLDTSDALNVGNELQKKSKGESQKDQMQLALFGPLPECGFLIIMFRSRKSHLHLDSSHPQQKQKGRGFEGWQDRATRCGERKTASFIAFIKAEPTIAEDRGNLEINETIIMLKRKRTNVHRLVTGISISQRVFSLALPHNLSWPISFDISIVNL